MNNKALRILEYHKIISLLVDKASSAPGKELCQKLTPMTDIREIEEAQQQTADAFSRLVKGGRIHFSGNKDISFSIKSLEIGSALSAVELMKITASLACATRAKTFARSERDEEITDSLQEYFADLEPLTPLQNEINRCILSEEEIADDASPALKHIRRSIRLTNEKIHSQLSSMVNGNCRTYLQDAVITMRNNRYCIPVKSEHKGNVPGMIHDQSSTGSTLFIEPAVVVDLNNQLKELSLKEKDEIERILAELSATAGVAPALQSGPLHQYPKRTPPAARQKKGGSHRYQPRKGFRPAGHHRTQHRRKDGVPKDGRALCADGAVGASHTGSRPL